MFIAVSVSAAAATAAANAAVAASNAAATASTFAGVGTDLASTLAFGITMVIVGAITIPITFMAGKIAFNAVSIFFDISKSLIGALTSDISDLESASRIVREQTRDASKPIVSCSFTQENSTAEDLQHAEFLKRRQIRVQQQENMQNNQQEEESISMNI